MKKEYVSPEMEVVELGLENVIASSYLGGGEGSGVPLINDRADWGDDDWDGLWD